MHAEDVLKYGHDFVHRYLVDFPAGEWETPDVCGWWSTKLILAHLASFEHLLGDVLATFRGEPFGPQLQRMAVLGGENFNEFEVAARADWSVEAVLADFDGAYEENLAQLRDLPLETRRKVGMLGWYGPEYDLEDFLAYSFYGHKREHTAQVNVFLDGLRR